MGYWVQCGYHLLFTHNSSARCCFMLSTVAALRLLFLFPSGAPTGFIDKDNHTSDISRSIYRSSTDPHLTFCAFFSFSPAAVRGCAGSTRAQMPSRKHALWILQMIRVPPGNMSYSRSYRAYISGTSALKKLYHEVGIDDLTGRVQNFLEGVPIYIEGCLLVLPYEAIFLTDVASQEKIYCT